MTLRPSEQSLQAYVWAWLPGSPDPLVVGLSRQRGDRTDFAYAGSYLERPDAVSLYEPELPLRAGWIRPLGNLAIAGAIRDAGPDAWGQRVVMRRLLDAEAEDVTSLSTVTYLLESGSDRIGALDFQTSPINYVPRVTEATLVEMADAAELLQAGEPLTPDLDAALLHGTSVGGARPKVTLIDGDRYLIAKLSSTTDSYPVVKSEAAAMLMADRCGIDVPHVEVVDVLGRDVMLVERFDRISGGGRRMMVSALTISGFPEEFGHYATYWGFAQTIRERFTGPDAALRELFSRITFNICVSNTDDHAKNHAAFWDGHQLTLTPAYDVCPAMRSGGETMQAMAIGADGWRYSQLSGCLDRANLYGLTKAEARQVVDHQIDTIIAAWQEVADRAHLTTAERQAMWGRQILSPYCLYDYPRSVSVPRD